MLKVLTWFCTIERSSTTHVNLSQSPIRQDEGLLPSDRTRYFFSPEVWQNNWIVSAEQYQLLTELLGPRKLKGREVS